MHDKSDYDRYKLSFGIVAVIFLLIF